MKMAMCQIYGFPKVPLRKRIRILFGKSTRWFDVLPFLNLPCWVTNGKLSKVKKIYLGWFRWYIEIQLDKRIEDEDKKWAKKLDGI
jgi:hypothetical protein